MSLPARRIILFALLPTFLTSGSRLQADSPRRTKNVIVVTLDGFRWQELFTRADETLLDEKAGGVRGLNRPTFFRALPRRLL